MPRARNAIASTATRTPRIVTTRTPLFDEAGWREDGTDLGEMRSDIFLTRNLDGPNHVEMAGEIRFFAQRVWRCFGSETVRPWAETLTDLPHRAIGVQFVEGNLAALNNWNYGAVNRQIASLPESRIGKIIECTGTVIPERWPSWAHIEARKSRTSLIQPRVSTS
jgi:hypothetical protein